MHRPAAVLRSPCLLVFGTFAQAHAPLFRARARDAREAPAVCARGRQRAVALERARTRGRALELAKVSKGVKRALSHELVRGGRTREIERIRSARGSRIREGSEGIL